MTSETAQIQIHQWKSPICREITDANRPFGLWCIYMLL